MGKVKNPASAQAIWECGHFVVTRKLSSYSVKELKISIFGQEHHYQWFHIHGFCRAIVQTFLLTLGFDSPSQPAHLDIRTKGPIGWKEQFTLMCPRGSFLMEVLPQFIRCLLKQLANFASTKTSLKFPHHLRTNPSSTLILTGKPPQCPIFLKKGK